MHRDRYDELVETLRNVAALADDLDLAASDCDKLAESLEASGIDELAAFAKTLAKDLDRLTFAASELEEGADEALREHTRLAGPG
jgi:HPt (histidine-containing phosphotransfer) domain-containing protein